MSRVIVTGATGFVGLPCLSALLERGFEVHAVSRHKAPPDSPVTVKWHCADLMEPEQVEGLLSALKPDRLLHLAWITTPGEYWETLKNNDWEIATIRLVKAFRKHGGGRAVIAGSCAEYDWSRMGPNGTCIEDPDQVAATLYGKTKASTRVAVSDFANSSGMTFAWARIFFPFGPGEPSSRLLPSIIETLLEGREAKCTDGHHERDFIYVRDVARAMAMMVDSNVSGTFDTGTGIGTSIRNVVMMVAQELKHQDLVRFGAIPMRPGEPRQLIANTKKLHATFGFQPETSLADGLLETISWWRARGLHAMQGMHSN